MRELEAAGRAGGALEEGGQAAGRARRSGEARRSWPRRSPRGWHRRANGFSPGRGGQRLRQHLLRRQRRRRPPDRRGAGARARTTGRGAPIDRAGDGRALPAEHPQGLPRRPPAQLRARRRRQQHPARRRLPTCRTPTTSATSACTSSNASGATSASTGARSRPSPAARGRWLGEVYAESDARLNFRKDVARFPAAAGAGGSGVRRRHRPPAQVPLAQERRGRGYRLPAGPHHPRAGDQGRAAARGRRDPQVLADRRRPAARRGRQPEAVRPGRGRAGADDDARGAAGALGDRSPRTWTSGGRRLPRWREEVRETFAALGGAGPGVRRALARRRGSGAWPTSAASSPSWARHFDVWFFESEVEEEGKRIVAGAAGAGASPRSARGCRSSRSTRSWGWSSETYRTHADPALRRHARSTRPRTWR